MARDIEAGRLELCRAFLDDCYRRWDGREIKSRDNTVWTYSRAECQVSYSIMYFAKYVGCWSAIREAVDHHVRLGPAVVVSLGAGPQFCLMGWYFDRPPRVGDLVLAVDILDWRHVCAMESHRSLLRDVLVEADSGYIDGVHFPDSLPSQCQVVAVKSATDPFDLGRIPFGATVLLPMVLNHIVDPDLPAQVRRFSTWLRLLEGRAGRIVIADLDSSANDTTNFWREIASMTGLTEHPPVFEFADNSARFAPCYPDTLFEYAPERERRTGIKFPRFCRVSGCVFDRGRGWRWLTR